jgi:hypothetical protein
MEANMKVEVHRHTFFTSALDGLSEHFYPGPFITEEISLYDIWFYGLDVVEMG